MKLKCERDVREEKGAAKRPTPACQEEPATAVAREEHRRRRKRISADRQPDSEPCEEFTSVHRAITDGRNVNSEIHAKALVGHGSSRRNINLTIHSLTNLCT